MGTSESASESAIGLTLEKVFGFTEFRGQQRPVIDTVMAGQSSLLLMPTGMGKSLCYQLPARLFSEQGRGLTLVISPLISLMKDQVDAALAKGLRAAFINSSLSGEERASRYKRLARGDYELLYVTPERFRIPEFRSALAAAGPLALLAIDEAHCISAWGHDFRPDYSRLGDIRAELGSPLTIALTATATPQVAADILNSLKIPDARVFNSGVSRPNLAVSVLDVHGIDEKVRAFFAYRHLFNGPAIIYFSLIGTLRLFSDSISRLGVPHLTYHGQMNDRDRKRSQETFLASSSDVILATPAFGLGVDKPNVRLVMHAEVPGSIEAYYQEIGRSGRDGIDSACVLLFDDDDVSIQNDFMNWANPDPGFIRAVYNLIDRNLVRARQEGFDYLRTQMNFYNRRDFRVETAVGQLERWGSLEGRQPREWKPLESPPDEYLDQKLYESRMKGQRQKLYQMVELAKMTEGCRMVAVADYFGFAGATPCGKCDLCVSQIANTSSVAPGSKDD
jgi:ATP-dependent DNA helicase RecQ